MTIYTVRAGDSLHSIARRFSIAPSSIASANELSDPSYLIVGQDLVIPTEGERYIVEPGDSLYSIAVERGINVDSIIAANPNLRPLYVIRPWQVINIPETAKKKSITVNGYAYPNIEEAVLRKTLPYLTYLSIFSYRVRADGSLDGINDAALIEAAKNSGVAPLMTVTNTGEGGGFNSTLIGDLLNNEAAGNNLINNIMSTIAEKGYHGVNIDFEYIPQSDREAYNSFLARLSPRLESEGYILTTAVAPKVSADQQGRLYEAHDYAFHGRTADYVVIMTYEWGYTYGPPMAVAPINSVRRVLNYAVTDIPPEKILMGVSNYGYDWTLPYREGTAARVLTVKGAVEQAGRTSGKIDYSTASEAPFYEYYDSTGRRHIVWFENARSIRARLRLVEQYGLGGISFWTVNRFFPQSFLVLSDMYNIRKVRM